MPEHSHIDLCPNPRPLNVAERAARLRNLGFGSVFTDNMIVGHYDQGAWQSLRLQAYAPLSFDPALSCLHYGQAIFEGFKAYHQADGSVASFRPRENAKRFQSSARRLAMPEMPVELFVEAADTLIRQDREWVPTAVGESLYIRPLLLATDVALGVRPAKKYLFVVIASPCGAYFPKGVKPVSVWLSTDYVRAAPGGTGEAKCAGNYAASLVAQAQAQAEGCEQVVWLDAKERRYVEEMGGMNLFFVYQTARGVSLVTPALTGSLLPGITRDSILTLARDLGYEVVEGTISVEDWERDLKNGELTEVFACGTAAVVTPVGSVKSARGGFEINRGQPGPVANRIRQALMGIQYGTERDVHSWMHSVCPADQWSGYQQATR